jgi:hypothetical protein
VRLSQAPAVVPQWRAQGRLREDAELAEAERAKRKVEEQFGTVPGGAVRVKTDARMTVARAGELFLISEAGQAGKDVPKKYEWELKRLEDFLGARGKFTLPAIDSGGRH